MRLTVVFASLVSLFLSTESGCCGLQASPEQRTESARLVAKAREYRSAGHLEAALETIEKALGLNPAEPTVWGERGKICFGLYTFLAGEGRTGLERIGFFEDTRFSLERAISLGSRDSEVFALLARLLREQGLLKEAEDAAGRALDQAKDRPTRLEALLELGLARTAGLARMKEQEEAADRVQRAGAAAAAPLEEATSLDPGRAQAWVALADAYAALGNEARELDTLRRGLAAVPSSEPLHSSYQERLFARGRATEADGFLAGMLRENPGNATARWFRGRARLARAEEQRLAGKQAQALELYEQAVADWLEAARLRPTFTASSNQAIAFARLGSGALLTEQGRLEQAAENLIEAFKLWPAIFDQRDRFGHTYASAMGAIGRLLMGGGRGFFGTDPRDDPAALLGRPATFETRAASLRKAISFHRLLIAMHPDRTEHVGYWYNNLGLALRDLGRLIADQKAAPPAEGAAPAPPPETIRLWEEAYAAYRQAAELLPEDPRIVNDWAVMLVYHLHRDFDQAEKLLRRAIDLAQSELTGAAEGMNEETRNFYEEAAGDAWENLGLLHLWHRNDPAAARPHLETALKFYPYGARAAARTLRTLPQAEKPGSARSTGETPAVAGALHYYAYALPAARPAEDLVTEARKLLGEAARNSSPSEAMGLCAEAAGMIEAHLRKVGPSAPLLLLLGQALQGMARAESAGRKPDGLAIEGYLEEAAIHLKKAIELERGLIDAHIALLEVEQLRGSAGAPEKAARGLAGLVAERDKKLDPAQRGRAAAAAGQFLYLEYARQKSGQTGDGAKADEKLGELAADMLGEAFEIGLAGKGRVEGLANPQAIAIDFCLLRRWQGRATEAVQLLARWAAAAGADPAVLAALLEAGRGGAQEEAAGALTTLVQKKQNDPMLGWYLGAALCEAADEKRRIGEAEAAVALYDRSIAAMRKVIQLQPGFTDNSRLYIVRALSGKGFAARALKKLDQAAALFLEALKEDPGLKDTQDSMRLSPAQGIAHVTDDLRKAGLFDPATQLYRKALELIPHQIDWSNNLGLMARDLGAHLDRQGQKKRAQELFDLSLWGYRNALKYAPQDPRLINDLAVIMVYYLPRMIAEGETHLKRALALGRKQLEAFPANDPAGKEALSDTIGDILQNIGYIEMTVHRNLDAAEKALQESLLHSPYDSRPAARGHLAAIHAARAQAEAKKRAEEERLRKEEEERLRKEEEERRRQQGREQGPGKDSGR